MDRILRQHMLLIVNIFLKLRSDAYKS